VWHVSVSRALHPQLVAAAKEELAGVGLSKGPQWWEQGPKALHLRRRLTDEEAKHTGGVLDIRNSPEQMLRYAAVIEFCPPGTPPI